MVQTPMTYNTMMPVQIEACKSPVSYLVVQDGVQGVLQHQV